MEERVANILWIVAGIVIWTTACQSRQPDVLDDLGQAVLKSKEELEIDIKPHKVQ